MPALVMLGRVVRHSSPARLTDEPAPQPADLEGVRQFEDTESRVAIKGYKVHPFNQGTWPSEEEQAARQKEIRLQMRKMKRENPALYKRLPLLQEADD